MAGALPAASIAASRCSCAAASRSLAALVWLDGVIGGAVVAAVAAALVFEPVFDVTVEDGAASVARLAYPLGDLLCVGFVVVVWSLSGRRFDAFWALLGGGLRAARLRRQRLRRRRRRSGDWAPGGLLDLPYAAGDDALAAAAWAAPRRASAAPATSAAASCCPSASR